MTALRACPVCGNRGRYVLETLNYASFEGLAMLSVLDLVVCLACSCVYCDAPGLTEESLNRYYLERPNLTGAAGGGGSSRWDLLHYQDIWNRLRPFIKLKPKMPLAADVGAGGGGLVRFLRAAGLTNIFGLEPRVAWPQPEYLKEGSAARLPFVRSSAGLLIYSHVLEHLLEPGDALDEARRCLDPEGLIYVETPDASAYDPLEPYRQLYQEHINHFDHCSLADLLARRGFSPLISRRGRLKLPGGDEGVVWAVARPGNGLTALGGQGLHGQAAKALEEYLAVLSGGRRWPGLKGERVIIWGLSQQARLMMTRPPVGDLNIVALVDSDPAKQGRSVAGLEVMGPDCLSRRPRDEALLLTAWGAEKEMRAQARSLGFQGRILSLKDFYMASASD